MTIKLEQSQRIELERRTFSYSYYIPERRSGADRRENFAMGYPAEHALGNFSGRIAEKNAA